MKRTLLSSILISTLILFSNSLYSFKKEKKVTTLKEMKKIMQKGYSFVPSGNTIYENDTVSLQGFFMMKGEVTNMNYREYLSNLKVSGKIDEYKKALPDTTLWTTSSIHNKKYTDYYFNHPAYNDYPVVNITREQAEAYCVWLTENWRKNTGNQTLIFRLPKRAEYLRAANGSAMKRPFAWDAPFIRNKYGQIMCNHLALGNTNITRDPETNELKVVTEFDAIAEMHNEINPFTDVLAPSKSFWPNEFDLYNLNGNASEMVEEKDIVVGGDWNSPGYDVRNESTRKYTGASPYTSFRPVMTFVEIK
jgi:formylglycine-generating enzyme required for sulfatase activity